MSSELYTIKYSKEFPPNWKTLKEIWGSDRARLYWDAGLIVTYGDTCYSSTQPSTDFMVHENVHMRQQNDVGGPQVWWDRYFREPTFKLMQEVEAYQVQLKYLNSKLMDVPRPERKFKMRKYQEWVAETLSGEIYGNMISYNRAMELIK